MDPRACTWEVITQFDFCLQYDFWNFFCTSGSYGASEYFPEKNINIRALYEPFFFFSPASEPCDEPASSSMLVSGLFPTGRWVEWRRREAEWGEVRE